MPAHIFAGVEGLRAARTLVRAPHGCASAAASDAPAPPAASALPFYDILACINADHANTDPKERKILRRTEINSASNLNYHYMYRG